jgi:hypothetical protein
MEWHFGYGEHIYVQYNATSVTVFVLIATTKKW